MSKIIKSQSIFSPSVTIPNNFFGVHFHAFPSITVHTSNTVNGIAERYTYPPTTAFNGTNGANTNIMTRNVSYWHYLNNFVSLFGRGRISSNLAFYDATNNTSLIGYLDYVIDENTLVLKSNTIITPAFAGTSNNLIAVNSLAPVPNTSYGYSTIRIWDAGPWISEKSKGIYDFSIANTTVNYAVAQGKDPILVLYGTPNWMASSPNEPNGLWGNGTAKISNSPVANLQDWVDYCTTVANVFNGRVKYFEVLNEPVFPTIAISGIAGSNTVQVLTSQYNILNGQYVYGTGIPTGTYVVAQNFNTGINPISTSLILNNNLTSNINGYIRIDPTRVTRNISTTVGSSTVTLNSPLTFTRSGIDTTAVGMYIFDQVGATYTVNTVYTGNNTIVLNQVRNALSDDRTYSNYLWNISRNGNTYTVLSSNATSANVTLTLNESLSGANTTGWSVSRSIFNKIKTDSNTTTITTETAFGDNFNNKSVTILFGTEYFTGTIEQLSQITRLTNQAIKSVIPTAKILGPQTGDYTVETVKAMLNISANGFAYSGNTGANTSMKDWVDIVNIHTYTYDPELYLPRKVYELRQGLNSIGLSNTEIWSSEFGYGMPKVQCSFIGSISGNTLTVTSISSGTLVMGDVIFGTTATFFGKIVGTTLTVIDPNVYGGIELSGTISTNNIISGNGVVSGTRIVSNGTGTGGAGTYNITPSQTMTSNVVITSVNTVLYNTKIVGYGTGTGGVGTYILNNSQSISNATTMLTTLSESTTQTNAIKQISRIIMATAFGGCTKACYYQYDDPNFGSSDPVVIAGVASNINFIRGKTLANLTYVEKQGVRTGEFTAFFTDGTSITV